MTQSIPSHKYVIKCVNIINQHYYCANVLFKKFQPGEDQKHQKRPDQKI